MFLDGCWKCIMHDITFTQFGNVNEVCLIIELCILMTSWVIDMRAMHVSLHWCKLADFTVYDRGKSTEKGRSREQFYEKLCKEKYTVFGQNKGFSLVTIYLKSRAFPRVRGLETNIVRGYRQKIRPQEGSIFERELSEEPENFRFQSNWILNNLWLVKAMVILLGYLESLFIRGQDAFYLKLIDICNQKIEPNLEGSLFEFCQLKSTSDFSNFARTDSRGARFQGSG